MILLYSRDRRQETTKSALSLQITKSLLGSCVEVSDMLVKREFIVYSESKVLTIADLFHCCGSRWEPVQTVDM